MVIVVNKYKHTPTKDDIYCGRGSLVGNPYSHLQSTKALFKASTREEAVECFEKYFTEVLLNDAKVVDFLNFLKEKSKITTVYLVCFCKPKACHCDTIKEYLDKSSETILNNLDKIIKEDSEVLKNLT